MMAYLILKRHKNTKPNLKRNIGTNASGDMHLARCKIRLCHTHTHINSRIHTSDASCGSLAWGSQVATSQQEGTGS